MWILSYLFFLKFPCFCHKGTVSCLSNTLVMRPLLCGSQSETSCLLSQHAVWDANAPPSTPLKTPFEKDFLHLYSWPPIKRTLLLGFIYLYIAVVMCVNVCEHACLRVCVCVCVCVCVRGWVMCNCVCMCVNPQRYFNFFRILNKHAAAASAECCLPVGLGLDGWRCWWWRGRRGGFVAVALGGWGSSWSGPPPDTVAPRAGGLLNHHTPPPKPCQPWLSATSLPTQITQLSLSLSDSLSPSFLPDTFPSFSFLILLSRVQIHLLFGCLLISRLPLCF